MKRLKNAAAVFMAFIIALLPCKMTAFAISQDTIVSKLIMVAENEVGYTGTRTYSKYGEWYGYQGGWCSTFALWCFNETGQALGVKLYANIVPSGGNCSSMLSWFSNKGRYHTRSSGYAPKAGDLAFFDWNRNGSPDHVGIVKSTVQNTVYTIEGNCSGKVKERSYSPSGSKPYASTSSILGYANPNWSAVGSASSQSFTKAKPKKSAKRTSQKAAVKSSAKRTTQPSSTKKTEIKTAAQPAKTVSSSAKTSTQTTSATQTSAESTTKKPAVKAKNMTIHAATNTLQIGDSVNLDYEVTPANSSAAVGYFCDEDNVVNVSSTGLVTAKAEGVATVVVCANDEIYRQCDFTVTSVDSQVTTKSSGEISTIPYIGSNKANSKEQKLSRIGIDAEKLISLKNYYVIPICIIGATGITVLCIQAVKTISKAFKKRKNGKEN